MRDLNNQYEKSENDLKALQSVGQIVGEVLRQLTEEKFIVKVRQPFTVICISWLTGKLSLNRRSLL